MMGSMRSQNQGFSVLATMTIDEIGFLPYGQLPVMYTSTIWPPMLLESACFRTRNGVLYLMDVRPINRPRQELLDNS